VSGGEQAALRRDLRAVVEVLKDHNRKLEILAEAVGQLQTNSIKSYELHEIVDQQLTALTERDNAIQAYVESVAAVLDHSGSTKH